MKRLFVFSAVSIIITLNIISYSQIRDLPVSSETNSNFLDKLIISGNLDSGTAIWTELNPRVPRVDYYGVYFKDELDGFCVGEFGAIIKTSDGGITWVDKSFPTQKTLLRISGCDSLVLIVGTGGTILRSIDFGESWESLNLVNNVDIWGVFTFTNSVSMICTKDGQLLKTSDSGNSWQIDTIGYPLVYWDLKFMDSVTGFISCGDGIILKTTDAGNSWQPKQTGDMYSLYSLEILQNGKIIAAGSSGQIYYSTDSGESFTQSNVPITFIIEDLAFANNDIGIAIGQATVTNAILKTTDGGLNWELLNRHMGHLNVDFITDSVGYNVGTDLKIYKSSDQGNSWNLGFLNDDFYDIEFISASTGFVISSALYKTNNGGQTWNKIPNGVGGYSLVFIDSSTGFAGNNDEIINKTTDGGLSWYSTHYIPGAGQIKKIKFSSNTLGWALSNNLYKSTDTGESWIQVLSGTNYNDFFFIDTLTGWVVGNEIKKTTDGGIIWESINPPAIFYDVEFIDSNLGYAASGSLYNTTDGGHTWSLINGVNATEIEVVDSAMIITISDQGNVYISMDRGATWSTYNLPIGRSLKFYDKSRGYFVGDVGLIYQYLDSTYTPVELSGFYYRMEDGNIILEWTTASELNNMGFEIQRKSETLDWEKLGFENGNGTTANKNKYNFVDNNPSSGINTYRLKQIDFDGSVTYSKEIEIYVTKPDKFLLEQNYPNPFNPTTKIRFRLSIASIVTLKIFNSLGEEIMTLINKKMTAMGNYDVNFDASGLASGVYFYSLECIGVDGINAASIRKMVIIK